MQVFGNGHPFLSDPPSQDVWPSGQSTGQETGHVSPSMPIFIDMQNSGIEHPVALIPQGHLCSGGQGAGQKAGQPSGPEYDVTKQKNINQPSWTNKPSFETTPSLNKFLTFILADKRNPEGSV